MRRLFIAEKPSLARAIADVLAQPQRRDNYIECGSDIVAWCAGHILELADADAYDPDFKQWKLEHLPIAPTEWKLAVKTPDLLKTIKALLPRVEVVVNAGDPDREGQLLVDEVLHFLGFRGRVDRVLISDLNLAAVRKALGALQPNSNFRRLYDAALGRQRADWLYGINMTRLYTVLGRAAGYQDGVLSVGRVQTPLLGLIVRRDLEIEQLRPEALLLDRRRRRRRRPSVRRQLAPGAGADSALDDGGPPRSTAPSPRPIERKTAGQPRPSPRPRATRKRSRRPLPYSLADLQIDAGRKLGLNPKRSSTSARPSTRRIGSSPTRAPTARYLPKGTSPRPATSCAPSPSVDLQLAAAAAAADLSIRSKAWNDGKVTAHHAIIPTPRVDSRSPFREMSASVYDLIARRYLAQFFPPHEFYQLEAELIVAGERFVAKGRQPIALGWRRLYETPSDRRRGDDEGSRCARQRTTTSTRTSPIPPLQTGQVLRIAKARTLEKKTKPPRRFTAASLVQAMTGIARYVSDPRIKALLRETDGIGTPATQAAIIQRLFDRKYIEEKKRQIYSTPTARALIRALPDVATQPDMTALWESTLRKVQEGQAPLDGFLHAVRAQLGELVARAKSAGPLNLPGGETRPCRAPGCTGTLRKRAGKNGTFWACRKYPDCKFTEDAEKRTMVRSGGNNVRGGVGRPSRTRRSNRNRKYRGEHHEPTGAE